VTGEGIVCMLSVLGGRGCVRLFFGTLPPTSEKGKTVTGASVGLRSPIAKEEHKETRANKKMVLL